jgi:probable addiction module antidote protein
MTRRSVSYKQFLHQNLRDNAEAANYLQAALEDSQDAFLVALKNVLDARKVAVVARASKVRREQIYQMLTEGGNPTLNSLQKILHALGLRLSVEMATETQIIPPGATVGQESSTHTATF